MKICFLWNFNKAPEIYDNWRDGLRGAIEHIGKTHDVDIYLGEDCMDLDEGYDVLLFWTDTTDPIIAHHRGYKARKGLFLTTDPHDIENIRHFDVVFCESDPVYDAVRRAGVHAVKAFGTDTDFYKPAVFDEVANIRDIEYFYPATFSPWKLQGDIAYLGDKLWCVGTVQPDGQAHHDECVKNGCHVAVGYFKAEYILELYQRTQKMIIPAVHGSERTVLEAMACDIVPEVTNPANVRTRSYIEEYKKSGLSPREFVVKNYSHTKYGDTIIKAFN